MNIRIPVVDGYDAAHRIRLLSDKAKADIPIYAMTVNAFDEDKQKSLDS